MKDFTQSLNTVLLIELYKLYEIIYNQECFNFVFDKEEPEETETLKIYHDEMQAELCDTIEINFELENKEILNRYEAHYNYCKQKGYI